MLKLLEELLLGYIDVRTIAYYRIALVVFCIMFILVFSTISSLSDDSLQTG
jgi:hypothetical protein